jgi:hypothetical protein
VKKSIFLDEVRIRRKGWEWSSVVECLLCVGKALGSIVITDKKKKKEQEIRK